MGDDDVGVALRPAAVNHGVDLSDVHDGHDALRGSDGHVEVGHRADLAGPRARRVDDVFGGNLLGRPGGLVRALSGTGVVSDLDAVDIVAVAQQVDHLGMSLDARTVTFGIQCVRDAETERVDRTVRNLNRARDIVSEIRLDFARLASREHRRWNVAVTTALEFLSKVLVRVLGTLDEQAAGLLDAVARDFSEDLVLLDTFRRAGLVRDSVAAAAVQETVHSASRSIREGPSLDECDVDAAHRQIAGDATAGRTAAEDEDRRIVCHPFVRDSRSPRPLFYRRELSAHNECRLCEHGT